MMGSVVHGGGTGRGGRDGRWGSNNGRGGHVSGGGWAEGRGGVMVVIWDEVEEEVGGWGVGGGAQYWGEVW